MIRGIIYKYTSPNDKAYIGQTMQEEVRRKLWNSLRYHYAGEKIDRARAKYGYSSFTYELLFEKEFATKEIALLWLNTAEKYYIRLYDTVNNGYNCEYGGGGNANHTGATNHHRGGYKLSEETKRRIGEASRIRQNTPEGRAKMSEARRGRTKSHGYRIEAKYKPIIQLTKEGVFIQEFASIRDAGEAIADNSKSLCANISAVCKGRRESAGGYKWMFKDNYKAA